MATLRLKFPDKNTPSVLALTGARLTIGRNPNNTVQIVDRAVSGFHAELIREDDHYRLHDAGSTNGTYVNGEKVADFHLREGCKLSFGEFQCDFDPAEASDLATTEGIPTQAALKALKDENAELKQKVTALQAELDTIRGVKPATPVPVSAAAPEKPVAAPEVKAEPKTVPAAPAANVEPAPETTKVEAEMPVPESAPAPVAETKEEPVVAKDEAAVSNEEAKDEPVAPAPAMPAAEAPEKPAPAPLPPKSFPKPATVSPALPGKTGPGAPLPKPPLAKPAVAPPANLPKPSLPGVGGVRPAVPVAPASPSVPVGGSGVRPLPVAKPLPGASQPAPVPIAPTKPLVKPMAATPVVPVRPAGPAGTQKIGPAGTQKIGADAAKPVIGGKPPLKPMPKPLSGLRPAVPKKEGE